jgi:chitinase
MKSLLTFLIFTSFASLTAIAQGRSFLVIGSFASWRGHVEEIEFDKLTQVNFAFGIPDSNGFVSIKNAVKLKELVFLAHRKNVKVFLSVGGWDIGAGGGNDSAFETVAKHAESRKQLSLSLLELSQEYKLDGINLDWEYPDSTESFLALAKEVSTTLHTAGKSLSTSVAGTDRHGKVITKECFQYFDLIQIMAYDGPQHSPYDFAESCLNYWIGKGCPNEKLILGLPFYGRSPSTHYSVLLEKDPRAYSKDDVNGIHYNGIETIQKKTSLAKERANGVMIWDLSMDVHNEYSLLRAINEMVKK